MKNTSNKPISSLDFDEIKSNLKEFLRGQTQFKDYDFEGSSMSIILDLLAYNTHYQAFYANMAANESFLDSAVIRSSVVSLAKHLDYTPRSKKAASLVVDIYYDSTVTDEVFKGTLFLEAGTLFRGVDENGKSINFVNLESKKVERVNGQNVARSVTLSQGVLAQSSFVANVQEGNKPVFIIPDKNIDIDTIVGRVSRSTTDSFGSGLLWKRARDITKIDGTSPIFFVQQGRDSFWEIYFGDGILGKALENGNVVTFTYLRTSGSAGNNVGYDDTVTSRAIRVVSGTSTDSISDIVVQTDDDGNPQPSFGGREEEDIQSIKYYAPRSYQAQERAVTANDYLAILGREYSDRADSFFIWGGEESDPPQYGKVFISIKPKIGNRLSLQEKQAIERTILQGRNLVTITPEVVDPDVISIQPNVLFYYDEARTTLSSSTIEGRIADFILAYTAEQLGRFARNFRMSSLTSAINASSPASISSSMTILISKELELNLGNVFTYKVSFDNPLYHPLDGYTPILSSEVFGHKDTTSTSLVQPNVDAFLEDDGFGNIRIFKLVGSRKVNLVLKAGTINYETGAIVLSNFRPEYLAEGETSLKLTVQPKNPDILARRNQVLQLVDPIVTAVPERVTIDNNTSDSAFPA
jgi:hypothetical protein